MNITHTKVLEPKKQAKIPPLQTKKKEVEEDAEFGKRSRPTPPSRLLLVVGSLIVGWIWEVAKEEKEQKAESVIHHSSFVLLTL
jgi:hypothetical protein